MYVSPFSLICWPPCLVVGVGLLHNEAIAYAEEHGIVPSGSKNIPTGLFLACQDIASHFSTLFGCRIEAPAVLSRKCDLVLALYDSYSRPADAKSRRNLRDVMEKLLKIFPAARERCGWSYWATNDSMYPEGCVAQRCSLPCYHADYFPTQFLSTNV